MSEFDNSKCARISNSIVLNKLIDFSQIDKKLNHMMKYMSEFF